MRKLSSFLLMALAAAPSAQSDPGSFTGFYVGENLGWTERSDKTTFEAYDVTIPPRVEQNGLNKQHKTNGLNYGLYAGYGQNNNGFYWGAEFNVEHDTSNKGHTNNDLEIKVGGIPAAGINGRLYRSNPMNVR